MIPTALRKRIEPLVKDFAALDASCDKPLPKTIRTNTIKITPTALKTRLEAKGWKLTATPLSDVFIVDQRTPARCVEHQLGLFYIQGLASCLPALALAPQPGERVLDLCAAPGSKATQMVALMQNKGLLVANDASRPRLEALKANLQRCGVFNCAVTAQDARRIQGQFDKILLDAPCSGDGMCRSDREAMSQWTEIKSKTLAKLQKRLLAHAFSLLRPGGSLVYSTCAMSPQEDEEVVQSLLDTEKSAKLTPITITFPHRDSALKQCWRLFPQDDTEGFFIARIEKHL